MTKFSEDVANCDAAISRHTRAGYLLAGGTLVCILGWGSLAQIAGAVVAPAQVSVEFNSKKIQHREGGVIAAILVAEGDHVRQGQVVARMQSMVPAASAASVNSQVIKLRARKARLEAERDDLRKMIEPYGMQAMGGQEALALESRILSERAAVRTQKKRQLQEQVRQTRQEIEAMAAQKQSLQSQIVLLDRERPGVQSLYTKGLATITRLNDLDLQAEKAMGEAKRLSASIAASQARIAETQLLSIQVDAEAKADALSELKEVEMTLADFSGRAVEANDIYERVEMRAPVSGHVQQITQAVGGVLASGEALMLVVPDGEPLILEARIEPRHIDQVRAGDLASIRLTSFSAVTTPELPARIDRLSADVETDPQTGSQFYVARVRLETVDVPKELRDQLVPGMPAEVNVPTKSRSALSYFLKPLSDRLAHTFKED